MSPASSSCDGNYKKEAIFNNIPQPKEKDWPVWKFHVTHALKVAEQWQFVTGEAISCMWSHADSFIRR